MAKLWRLLKIIDDNLLKILLVFFIFFIPLYPKFPLKTVNFTYIAIRLEDLYLTLITAVFLLQLLRKKVVLNKFFLKPIIIFWTSVFISYLIGLYLTKTVVFPQVGLLHVLRRVEYMIVFFIAGSTIKSINDFKIFLYSLLLSLFFVNLYGLGQRFFGLPAISTMNPEFARGHLLYLTPEARISSTFAGHYDLAGYLVFLIPIVWGIYFSSIRIGKKWLIFLLAIFSLLILVYTASRISFIAYIISTPLFLLFLKKYRYFFFVLFLSILLAVFTRDLTKRFLKTVQIKQILINEKTGQIYIPQKITTKELPAGSLVVKIKEETKETSETADFKKKLIAEATISGKIATSEAASLSSQIKPISAIAYDISFATRFQVEWPRAIKAFIKNPLFGTGPSSLTEATDNDYLRWLGETGLLGFITFLMIIFSLVKFIFNKMNNISSKIKPLFLAVLFSIFGLLINASYIDVFEASKIAYVFWYVMGIYTGVLSLRKSPLKL